MRGNPLVYLALAVACLMLMPVFAHEGAASSGLAIGALGMLIAAGAGWVRGRRDPYDLTLLKDVHEREEARQLEPDEPGEYGSVLCPHCGTVYATRFKVCPHCMRSP